MDTPKEMWESRYADSGYVYGTAPNDYLVACAEGLTPGRALCLADGEGRNGVYLATLGFEVTSVDLTQAGMGKASHLATERDVSISTVVADLADFDLGDGRWDLIVSIFAHMPPAIRQPLHGRIAAALAPGGKFVLEAYTPDQIGRGTGGPPNPALTMTLAGLTAELVDLNIVEGREVVRSVIEGPGHTGDGAVVQLVAEHSTP